MSAMFLAAFTAATIALEPPDSMHNPKLPWNQVAEQIRQRFSKVHEHNVKVHVCTTLQYSIPT